MLKRERDIIDVEINKMSNDERVKELGKRISNTPRSSSSLPNKKPGKVNVSELKKLAKDIRRSLKDYSIETTAHTHTGK